MGRKRILFLTPDTDCMGICRCIVPHDLFEHNVRKSNHSYLLGHVLYISCKVSVCCKGHLLNVKVRYRTAKRLWLQEAITCPKLVTNEAAIMKSGQSTHGLYLHNAWEAWSCSAFLYTASTRIFTIAEECGSCPHTVEAMVITFSSLGLAFPTWKSLGTRWSYDQRGKN